MEELRNKVYPKAAVESQFLASGEPIQPILDAIEEELHLHFNEYCHQDHLTDFLLSFQLKKLLNCCELLHETCIKSGASLFKEAKKGKEMARPFMFDRVCNMFQ